MNNMNDYGDYNTLSYDINDYKSETPYNKSNECCLVEKKYVPDNSHEKYGGKFIYKFNKLEDSNCNLSNFRLDSNKQLFFNNKDNWSNENCDINNNILGSCRDSSKICVEFIDKKTCDNYKMSWSDKTCNEDINYNSNNYKKIDSLISDYKIDNLEKTFRLF
jgi:hypothetical protein